MKRGALLAHFHHLLLLCAVVGCVEPGTPSDASIDTPPEAPAPIADPTFAEHVRPIFEDRCRGCHTAAFPFAELVLPRAYSQLVDVVSIQVPGMTRVEPGAPSESYLFRKLMGTHRAVGGEGDAMPAARDPLSEYDLGTVRTWIEQGAPP